MWVPSDIKIKGCLYLNPILQSKNAIVDWHCKEFKFGLQQLKGLKLNNTYIGTI